MRPTDLEVVEVLEEVDDCEHGISKVGRAYERVAAALRFLPHVSYAQCGSHQYERCRNPDDPMSLELLDCSFELIVGDVPPEIDQPSHDLCKEGGDQGAKQAALAPSIDCSQRRTAWRYIKPPIPWIDACSAA